jgi:hypothetical protein
MTHFKIPSQISIRNSASQISNHGLPLRSINSKNIYEGKSLHSRYKTTKTVFQHSDANQNLHIGNLVEHAGIFFRNIACSRCDVL